MKLNGYRASHKNKWFLITKQILSIQEFVLFECYLDKMAFDKSHEGKFALFEAFPDDIALVFDKTNETVQTWHNGLLKKGFIKPVDEKRHLYTIKNPLRYIVGLEMWGGEASKYTHEEKDKTQEFILENIRFSRSESEKILADFDEIASEPSTFTENSLGSSKDSSIVVPSVCSKKVVVIKQEVRTDAEYQKIYADGNFKGLPPDEMKFIDQISSEEIEVENNEQEKEKITSTTQINVKKVVITMSLLIISHFFIKGIGFLTLFI